MHTHHSHQQYAEWLSDNFIRYILRNSRKLSDDLLSAALVLLGLDNDKARNILESLYSPNPRGRPPYEPICMLRALLPVVLLKYKSIPKFASDLKASHRFAITAGFAPDNVPVAGTFYLFIDRLEDGEYQAPSFQTVKPNSLRKGKHLRNLATEMEYEITPVIALNKRSSSPKEPYGTADKVDKDGIPPLNTDSQDVVDEVLVQFSEPFLLVVFFPSSSPSEMKLFGD